MTWQFLRRLLVASLLLVPAAAHALVALPGSTPQQALAAQPFEPIRLRVTDASGAAMPSGKVRWYLPYAFEYGLTPLDPGACEFELGYFCEVQADASGIATLPRMVANGAGKYTFEVRSDHGSLVIELEVLPLGPAPIVEVADGAGQRAVIGRDYAKPITVRVRRADGTPLADATVFFFTLFNAPQALFRAPNPAGGPDLVGNSGGLKRTDQQGVAVSLPLKADWGLGEGRILVRVFDRVSGVVVETMVHYVNTMPDGGTFASFQDMWWGGPSESGWGLSVVQHGETLFAVLFGYDDRGEPTWWVMPGGRWQNGFGSSYSGFYPTRSTPYFAYDASRFEVLTDPFITGTLGHLSFRGPEAAELQFQSSITNFARKNLRRQDFSSGRTSPLQGLGDMWWGGPSQNGWGLAIMEQPGGLFVVWLTYDAAGKPTWFVMPAGDWSDGTTWSGTAYRTKGTPLAAYDASKLRVDPIGTMTLRFGADRNTATFIYEVEGHRGTIPIERMRF